MWVHILFLIGTLNASAADSGSPSGAVIGTLHPSGVASFKATSLKTTKIYIIVNSHNEDPSHKGTPRFEDADSEATYWAYRDVSLEAAIWLKRHGIPYSYQSDWNLINGMKKYEIDGTTAMPKVRFSALNRTGGKNLIQFLSENLDVEIDAHSHQNADTAVSSTAYNYTDVAYLIQHVSGVTPSSILGGQVINQPNYGNWPQYKSPVSGSVFPNEKWTFTAIMGSGTSSHSGEIRAAGIWSPTEPGTPANYDNYFVIDPASRLVAIGNYEATATSIQYLLDQMAAGKVCTDCMITAGASFHTTELVEAKYGPLDSNTDRITATAPNSKGVRELLNGIYGPLKAFKDAGLIEYVTFEEALSIWKTEYASKPFLCMQLDSESPECEARE